jgi:hypothetical protein
MSEMRFEQTSKERGERRQERWATNKPASVIKFILPFNCLQAERVQPHYLVDSSKNYRKMSSNEQITTT